VHVKLLEEDGAQSNVTQTAIRERQDELLAQLKGKDIVAKEQLQKGRHQLHQLSSGVSRKISYHFIGACSPSADSGGDIERDPENWIGC
jgi:hypothetical protein